jgi:hypothetical protein
MAAARKRFFALCLRRVWLNHAVQDVEQGKAERMSKPIRLRWRNGGAAADAVLGGNADATEPRGARQARGKSEQASEGDCGCVAPSRARARCGIDM